MAISVVDQGIASGSADGTTQTWSITVTGGDILVIAFPMTKASSGTSFSTPHTATYNGSAMTLEGFYGVTSTTNRWHGHAFGYLVSPATGTNTVSLTADVVLAGGQRIYFWTLTGVDTADPFGANNSTNGTDTMSVSVSTTVADSWILAVGSAGDSTNPSIGSIAWTSPTAELATGKPQWFEVSIAKREVTTAGSYVIEAAESGLSAMAISAIVLNPAAAGTTEEASLSIGRQLASTISQIKAAVRSLTIARSSTAAGAGTTQATRATSIAATMSAAGAGTAGAGAAITLGTSREAVAQYAATIVAQTVVNTTHGWDLTAYADAQVTVNLPRDLTLGIEPQAIADGAVAILRDQGWQAQAINAGQADVTIGVSLDAETAAGAAMAAEVALDILRDLATTSTVVLPGIIDVELTITRTLGATASGQAIAEAVAQILRQNGMEAQANATTSGQVFIAYSLDAAGNAGNSIAGAITIGTVTDTDITAGQVLGGQVTIARTAQIQTDAGLLADAEVTITRAITAAMVGNGQTVASITVAKEVEAGTRWLSLLFTANERRTYQVKRERRRLRIIPQSRRTRNSRQ